MLKFELLVYIVVFLHYYVPTVFLTIMQQVVATAGQLKHRIINEMLPLDRAAGFDSFCIDVG